MPKFPPKPVHPIAKTIKLHNNSGNPCVVSLATPFANTTFLLGENVTSDFTISGGFSHFHLTVFGGPDCVIEDPYGKDCEPLGTRWVKAKGNRTVDIIGDDEI